ncbi:MULTISPECIES: hypothetical protein [unclassified Clostridium]|uniref:hypothetical protein n=1 Tax=unclassified Clostridium TaxID=2614128 RepID=UPI0025BA05FF|nr:MULTISPECIES: hypothetical protein [unclassified Clostridium]
MKISIEEKKLSALLQLFYSDYFCDYLEHMIAGDDEKSVVTLFKGMEFFMSLLKDLNVKFDYEDIEDFIVKEYYENLKEKYDLEIGYYADKEKNFEDILGGKLDELY